MVNVLVVLVVLLSTRRTGVALVHEVSVWALVLGVVLVVLGCRLKPRRRRT